MSASIIAFPRPSRRKRSPDFFVEVERCTDAVTGHSVFVFEIVADDLRVGIGLRNCLEKALDDIEWFRNGNVRVVEVGGPLGVPHA